MTFPTPSSDNVLNIYLALNQFPVLSGRIRARMRHELFSRGIITQEDFESEVDLGRSFDERGRGAAMRNEFLK